MNITVEKTDIFDEWLKNLKDRRAKAIILNHVDRIEDGNMGKFKSIGDGVFEKKIFYGPGYRLYFCNLGERWILLLCGGDKSTQKNDIKQAKDLKEKMNE